MKNIHEILKEYGIEIPEDKKASFDKALVENYKTIKEVEGIREKLEAAEKDRDTYKDKYDTDIAQRDSDLEKLKTQLSEAGQSKDKLATLQASLEESQQKYNEAKADWEKQLADQKYGYLVDEATRELKFSSKAAKKAFRDSLMSDKLQVKDDTLLGFDDFVNVYKESDPDSFLKDDDTKPGANPHFSSKTGKHEPDVSGDDVQHEAPEVPIVW